MKWRWTLTSMVCAAACVSPPPPLPAVTSTGSTGGSSADSTTGDVSVGTDGTDDRGTDEDTGDDTGNDTGPDDSVCGDGIIEGEEECDLGSQNGMGLFCTAFCTENVCGDGYLGPGEACDDGNSVDDDECTTSCGLPTCGDRVVQPGEECDLGRGNSNTGACLDSCIDASCGDLHIWVGTELCDGTNTGASDCTTEGFDGGTLTCTEDCTSFDTSNCRLCNNGVIEPGELCDGADVAGATCEDQIMGMPWTVSGGAPMCVAACTMIDYGSCTYCGDSVVEGTEDCDGADLNEQNCADVGFEAGTLQCNNDCTFDTSMCCLVEGNPCLPGRCCPGLSCDAGVCSV